jgi:hypothetical protein
MHRNLKTRSKNKPWKEKNGGKVPKIRTPQNNTYVHIQNTLKIWAGAFNL